MLLQIDRTKLLRLKIEHATKKRHFLMHILEKMNQFPLIYLRFVNLFSIRYSILIWYRVLPTSTRTSTQHISLSKSSWYRTAVLRIRNKSFGSGFGSGSGLKLVSNLDPVSDSNPDPNPGSGSRSETGQIFFCTKIFTQPHLQGCPPSALWLSYEQNAQKICDLWGSHTYMHIVCVQYIVPPPCRWTQSAYIGT